MPRAENRKRPPNSPAAVTGSAIRSKSDGVANDFEHQMKDTKKKALLEKMRKIQERQKANLTE